MFESGLQVIRISCQVSESLWLVFRSIALFGHLDLVHTWIDCLVAGSTIDQRGIVELILERVPIVEHAQPERPSTLASTSERESFPSAMLSRFSTLLGRHRSLLG